MKKIIAKCGIGFMGAEYTEEFEFEDEATENEIYDELYDWAEEFLEVSWEEVEK